MEKREARGCFGWKKNRREEEEGGGGRGKWEGDCGTGVYVGAG
jgi:hypothetical protein